MKRALILSAALFAACLSSVSTAHADGAWTGNVALATDYHFRGISQTDGDPAIQGGFDYANGAFYAGAWASNVAFSSGPELDLYGGVTPALGPVSLNLGVIAYLYPGASDDAAEFDYYEAKIAATIAPIEDLSLTGAAYYSPDYFGETDAGLFLELTGAYAITDAFNVSGGYGHQSIDDVDGPGPGAADGDYNTWNLGATYAFSGFTPDLRYVDTDIDTSDSVVTFATGDESLYDSAFVATLRRAL